MNTARPPNVASTRSRLTPPRTIAGTASTGRTRTAAKVSRFTAVMPATERPRSKPASTSIRYWSAAPTAPPAGATLASAPPASWEAITGRQRLVWRAVRWRLHRQTSVAASSAAIAASHCGIDPGEAVGGAEDLDEARRDQVERDARDAQPEEGAPKARPLRPAGFAALELTLDVCARLDRMLQPVADPFVLGHSPTVTRNAT